MNCQITYALSLDRTYLSIVSYRIACSTSCWVLHGSLGTPMCIIVNPRNVNDSYSRPTTKLLALYSDNAGLNPAGVYSFYLFNRMKRRKKRPGTAILQKQSGHT